MLRGARHVGYDSVSNMIMGRKHDNARTAGVDHLCRCLFNIAGFHLPLARVFDHLFLCSDHNAVANLMVVVPVSGGRQFGVCSYLVHDVYKMVRLGSSNSSCLVCFNEEFVKKCWMYGGLTECFCHDRWLLEFEAKT